MEASEYYQQNKTMVGLSSSGTSTKRCQVYSMEHAFNNSEKGQQTRNKQKQQRSQRGHHAAGHPSERTDERIKHILVDFPSLPAYNVATSSLPRPPRDGTACAARCRRPPPIPVLLHPPLPHFSPPPTPCFLPPASHVQRLVWRPPPNPPPPPRPLLTSPSQDGSACAAPGRR